MKEKYIHETTFPERFNHRHTPVKSTNQLFEAQLTKSQRAADWVVALIGSWKFIITQSILLCIWVLLNAAAWIHHWDPYPFILMNLMLSIQAAYAAPIIMMSQNRQAARDHMEAHNDYAINMLYFLFKGDSSLKDESNQGSMPLASRKKQNDPNKRVVTVLIFPEFACLVCGYDKFRRLPGNKHEIKQFNLIRDSFD